MEENKNCYIVKSESSKVKGKFKKFRGIATSQMSTDEIMNLTRES